MHVLMYFYAAIHCTIEICLIWCVVDVL